MPSDLVSPKGKQIKEWGGGFTGFQRSANISKDYGYGGVEESESLAKPHKPVLPFLGEAHMHQARSRVKDKKHAESIEQTRKELEEKDMGVKKSQVVHGKPSFLGTHTEFTTQPTSREPDASKLGKYSPTREMIEKEKSEKTKKAQELIQGMIKSASKGRQHPQHSAHSYLGLPSATRKEGKLKKKTSRDREEDRKSALHKLKEVSEVVGKSAPLKKDMEHLTAEHAKIDAANPALRTSGPRGIHASSRELGFSAPASRQTGWHAKEAPKTASPGVASVKPKPDAKSPFHESSAPLHLPDVPGAKEPTTVPVKVAVGGGKPLASASHEGDVVSSVPKTFKGMSGSNVTKSAILDLMMAKAQTSEQSPANPANEPGPVGGFGHAGKGRARTSVPADAEEQFPGNPSNMQGSVSGHAHAGKGPDQTSVSGTPHGGKGPARTTIPADGEEQFPGNPTQMNKADIHGDVHQRFIDEHLGQAEHHFNRHSDANLHPQTRQEHLKAANLHFDAAMAHQKAKITPAEKRTIAHDLGINKISKKAKLYSTEVAHNEDSCSMNKAHAGKGPADTDVEGEVHGGKGSKKKDVKGLATAGCEKMMSKAVKATAVPRMPRAMAMSMDTWRSATNVMTRGNSAMDKHLAHHGVGPLFPETCESIEEMSQERATRRPAEMIKSCGSCGRTYHVTKSMDDPCPTCSQNELSCMAKSRGGYLVSSFIKD